MGKRSISNPRKWLPGASNDVATGVGAFKSILSSDMPENLIGAALVGNRSVRRHALIKLKKLARKSAKHRHAKQFISPIQGEGANQHVSQK